MTVIFFKGPPRITWTPGSTWNCWYQGRGGMFAHKAMTTCIYVLVSQMNEWVLSCIVQQLPGWTWSCPVTIIKVLPQQHSDESLHVMSSGWSGLARTSRSGWGKGNFFLQYICLIDHTSQSLGLRHNVFEPDTQKLDCWKCQWMNEQIRLIEEWTTSHCRDVPSYRTTRHTLSETFRVAVHRPPDQTRSGWWTCPQVQRSLLRVREGSLGSLVLQVQQVHKVREGRVASWDSQD